MAANEHQQKEQQELREPAHHARRPMNAFLIFCKRHRGSVRSGFPHLENRAVTRVLGEWWATLHPDQKRSYTNLAQEYKDAFLNANPDFKWYKLPAPPLRTLSTRPTNKKSEAGSSDSSPEEIKSEESSSEFMKSEITDGEAIQPGKLADESQIGGLSSLFTPQKVQPPETNEIVNLTTPKLETDNTITPKPPKKRYTELPLSMEQKEDCKVDLFGEKNKTRQESNNNHQMDDDEKNETNSYFDESGTEEQSFRGERTCKGLRYQKFLAEQQRNFNCSAQQSKRRKTFGSHAPEQLNGRRNSISSNISEKTDSLSSEGNSSRGDLEHLVESAEGNIEASKPEETETEGVEGEIDFGPWSHKRFKAEDFNLEKKIEALPSLSLEEFQEKKKQQRTKKKKILLKANSSSGSKKSHEMFSGGNFGNQGNQGNRKNLRLLDEEPKEEEKNLLVGSQKRKARKQNITRNAALTNLSKQNDNQEPTKSWCASPDLEALACLATVAANRTKLTKSLLVTKRE